MTAAATAMPSVPLDAHQPHVDGHVVADEQEVVRARAAADLLDGHEHEHHDLDHDRVEVGRADDEALPVASGAGRPGKTRTRCASTAAGMPSDSQADRERQRAVRLDERPREEREAGADHERARPPLRAASRSDEARRDERDAGHDREGGERRALAAKLAPLDRRRGQRRARGSGGADADHDRVRAELGAGCCERGQRRSSTEASRRSASLRS